MATPEKSEKPRFVPAANRRNFKLSGLEMLIVALIVLGVIYLVSMWVGNAFAPEPEAVAPAAPAPLMEKALVASEKAQAQLSSLVNDLGSMRKDIEELRARRASASPGQPAPHSDGLDRRLDDLEKQVKTLVSHKKEDKPLAALAQDLKALAGRIEHLEKEQASKSQGSKTVSAPAADPKILARLERLEQVQARLQATSPVPAAPAPAAELSNLEQRLAKLEQGMAQVAKAPAPAPAANISSLEQRLAKLEQGMAQVAKAQANTPAASPTPAPRAAAEASDSEAKRQPKVAPRPAPSKPQPDHRKVSHKVKPGETMLGLARKYKVNMDDIVRWNATQLGDRRQLLIGETIVIIPGGNS